MGQISQFLRKGEGFYSHYCPACGDLHVFHVEKPNEKGHQWVYDGDIVAPTFFPSMLIQDVARDRKPSVCHYWLKDGVISFTADCTHFLKGVTMPLPPLPLTFRDRTTCLNF